MIVDDNSPDGTGTSPTRSPASSRAESTSCTAPAAKGLGRSYLDGIRRAINGAPT